MEGRLLPYITGGVALTHLTVNNSLMSNAPTEDIFTTTTWGASRVLVGGVLGGGFQYALGGGLSVGAEYLYAIYGTKDFSNIAVNPNNGGIGTLQSFPMQENHYITSQTVRLVANYKFTD
jgi:opacity protein-like surface antigen